MAAALLFNAGVLKKRKDEEYKEPDYIFILYMIKKTFMIRIIN